MVIRSLKVTNFGSFKELDFTADKLGLTLAYGPTGSGKSTLLDAPLWVLYGTTAKNGSVEDIRNWKTEDLTHGVVDLELHKEKVRVTRIRGNPNENDLYWEKESSPGKKYRGKDLQDTQKQLNLYLGVDSDFYSAATYFNEHSDAGMFFLAKAKEKRQLFEKLACLDFPIALAEKITVSKKQTKAVLESLAKDQSRLLGKLEQLSDNMPNLTSHSMNWNDNKANTIQELTLKSKYFLKEKESKIQAIQTKSYQFEADRQRRVQDFIDKLDALDQKIVSSSELDTQIKVLESELSKYQCPTCNQAKKSDPKLDALKERKKKNDQYKEKFAEYSARLLELQEHKNPYMGQVEVERKSENHYDTRIELEKNQVNPFESQIAQANALINTLDHKLEVLEKAIQDQEYKLNSLQELNDASSKLRSMLLADVVKKIQMNTNGYLEKHFDSEFKVSFELSGTDSLDVQITKNGYPCVYKQLSKGQKQLLKLCFSVSVMEAASNNIGEHFNLLCFDEALDGLDINLKLKAFNLFSALEKKYDSILLVDHAPEFHSLFSNKIQVAIESDESFIVHE